jgi:hypothetical protein
MLILATVVGDVVIGSEHGGFRLLLISAASSSAGLLTMFWAPISKNRVSASYVLVSLGISALVYWLFHLVWRRTGWQARSLMLWGKNPLALYVLHLVLLGLVALPDNPGWYVQAPTWLVVIQACGLIGLLSLTAWVMDKKGWIWKM